MILRNKLVVVGLLFYLIGFLLVLFGSHIAGTIVVVNAAVMTFIGVVQFWKEKSA